jgi:hypothetical protein
MVRRSGVTRIVPTPTVSTVQGVVQSLPPVNMARLPAPRYTADPKYIDTKVALAVEDMRHHMSDEGYQIFYGLGLNGYELCGHNLTVNETSVPRILDITKPKVLVIQDKREWDVAPGNFREGKARFTGVTALRERDDIFKVTLLKDAHQRPKYHAESADEMGIHAWITYYNTHIVKRLAPYVRPQHILRTYHTIDANLIPKYTADDRDNCLLSGAVSTAYPLRQRLFRESKKLPRTDVLKHPGYHNRGTTTPMFLNLLSGYKVAICTCSIYGYSLRKLIESTAAGCVVITNLPQDEYLPDIDGNLVRVPSDISTDDMAKVVLTQIREYDKEKQRHYAELCKVRYDFRFETSLLTMQIEELRRSYYHPATNPR